MEFHFPRLLSTRNGLPCARADPRAPGSPCETRYERAAATDQGAPAAQADGAITQATRTGPRGGVGSSATGPAPCLQRQQEILAEGLPADPQWGHGWVSPAGPCGVLG